MTNNLKIEVLVSNIPEDGSIASQFPSQEYVNQQLAKKANLSPEGRLDPSHAPDYTEIPGLYEHIEDTKDVIETSIADSLQDAKGYTNQQLSTSLQTKADLVNGKIPFDQIPFSADIEDQIQINVENITAVVDQKVAQVVEQVNGVATAANSYTDTKVAENKTYVDTTIGNVIEDVERLGVSKAVTIPTYFTPEAGVAVGTGVAAGAYYNVRSTEDDTVLVEYQNVGGSAIATGKSYPSTVYVQNVEKYTALPFVTGETYGLHARIQLENGDIVKSAVDGNANDPNSETTGWEYNETKFINNISELPSIKKYDSVRVFDKQTQTYFVYDSTKSTINDGVITFDGWVRQIENNTLLAIYAGVTEGLTSSQYTARLQALLSAAKDNYIIDFQFIPATVDTHLFISGKSGVVIESPNLTASSNFAFSGTSRGILRPSNCYGIVIQNHYVKGAKKTNPNVAMATSLGASGRFQDGDAGIELINCDDSHVRHGTVHHCKTWGILRIDCSGGSTHDNTVYDCVRQSGISPALGNGKVIKKPKVYRNTVSMCGLYGLEIENLSGSVEEPSVFDNNVSYCQGGLMLVNAISGLDANNNKISNCYYGLAGVGVNPSATAEGKLRNFYKNNTLTGNYMALAPSNSKYLSFISNPISGIITDEWLIQSPYDTVEKVASANSFYCLRNLSVGLQIKVNDTIYEVASSTAVTTTAIVEEIGLSTVYLIMLTANMIGVSDLTQFKCKITQTFGYNAFFQANTSIRVMRNIISDCTNAVNQTAVQADNADNMVSDNTFNKCTNVYTGNATGYRSKQSTFNDCTGVLTLQKVNSGNNDLRNLDKVQQGAVLNAVSPKPTHTFYSYSEQHLVRLRVVAKNVTWTSNPSNPISLVVRVNGTQIGSAISVSTQNSNVDTLLSAASLKLLDGANTVQIIDTSGSLGCDSWLVDVFVVD